VVVPARAAAAVLALDRADRADHRFCRFEFDDAGPAARVIVLTDMVLTDAIWF
jgi:hypothetical protein